MGFLSKVFSAVGSGASSAVRVVGRTASGAVGFGATIGKKIATNIPSASSAVKGATGGQSLSAVAPPVIRASSGRSVLGRAFGYVRGKVGSVLTSGQNNTVITQAQNTLSRPPSIVGGLPGYAITFGQGVGQKIRTSFPSVLNPKAGGNSVSSRIASIISKVKGTAIDRLLDKGESLVVGGVDSLINRLTGGNKENPQPAEINTGKSLPAGSDNPVTAQNPGILPSADELLSSIFYGNGGTANNPGRESQTGTITENAPAPGFNFMPLLLIGGTVAGGAYFLNKPKRRRRRK